MSVNSEKCSVDPEKQKRAVENPYDRGNQEDESDGNHGTAHAEDRPWVELPAITDLACEVGASGSVCGLHRVNGWNALTRLLLLRCILKGRFSPATCGHYRHFKLVPSGCVSRSGPVLECGSLSSLRS